ncbi:MAG: GNAT family N-acetyltransferase [Gemmatimonadaceae bacterium]|nr:GNAT family N-acetyltransferase [Gemmatimonadaceae bacterium]NUR21123.1 GNAT family N-acetyltransferase [Gemmatimonadaceae bacterium]
MSFATRHRDDPTSSLPILAGFSMRRTESEEEMTALQGRDVAAMRRRFEDGHRAYVALLDGAPAAWGWVATRNAEIGELGARFAIAAGERYLWNFVTLPSHRGLGIYPRLLQAIVRAESAEAERFWIAYAPENRASESGIRKAGFVATAEMSFDAAGRPALRAVVPGGDVQASRVLGLRVTHDALTPCWRCVRAGRPGMLCAEGSCRCDYQRAESGCAT